MIGKLGGQSLLLCTSQLPPTLTRHMGVFCQAREQCRPAPAKIPTKTPAKVCKLIA